MEYIIENYYAFASYVGIALQHDSRQKIAGIPIIAILIAVSLRLLLKSVTFKNIRDKLSSQLLFNALRTDLWRFGVYVGDKVKWFLLLVNLFLILSEYDPFWFRIDILYFWIDGAMTVCVGILYGKDRVEYYDSCFFKSLTFLILLYVV